MAYTKIHAIKATVDKAIDYMLRKNNPISFEQVLRFYSIYK